MLKRSVVLMLFGMIALVARPAFALDCDARVVDDAGIFGSGLSQVRDAAGRVAGDGADVHVITVSSLGSYANLDQYEAALERQCGSWQAANGRRKSNLLVLMLAYNRSTDKGKAGLYYGGTWTPRLGGTVWPTILSQQIAPRFRAHDYSGSAAAALDQINVTLVPPAAPPVTQQPAPVQPPAPVIVHTGPPPQPTDLTGLWSVMKWFLLLLAAGAVAIGLAYFFRARGKRRASQQKAQSNRGACSAAILELDDPSSPLKLQEARINDLAKKMSADDLVEVRGLLDAAKAQARQGTNRFGELNESGSTNPDRGGLSVEEYDGMAADFADALSKLRAAKDAAPQIETKVTALKKALDEAQPLIAALSTLNEEAATAIGEVQEKGFKTDGCEAVLAEAVKAVEDAESALKEKRYGAVKTACANGSAKAKQAKTDAEGLAKRAAAVDASIVALKARIPTVTASVVESKATFEQITAAFAATCWETVKGNGGQALLKIKAATEASETAAKAATMDAQDWATAERNVAEGNAALDQAESFLRSITALKKNLDQAKLDAPGEIDAAQRDIDALRAYEAKFDDDIRDDIKGEIAADQAVLDQAKAELRRDKPDYLAVIRLAKQANATADKLLGEAKGEHEAAERQRQKAASALRDAAAAKSRAKEYIEDHAGDVSDVARTGLRSAGTFYAEAERAGDPGSRIRFAGKAEEEADSALAQAKADVAAAEEARRPVYVAPTPTYRSSSDSTDAFLGGLAVGTILGSSSSGGGGRSASDDGFGGGGGGSISIGADDNDGGGGSIDIGNDSPGGGGSDDI